MMLHNTAFSISSDQQSFYNASNTGVNSDGLGGPIRTTRRRFWNRQRLNHQNVQNLWAASREVFLEGPDRGLPGVRVHANLASKEDDPLTTLCFVERPTPGVVNVTEVSLSNVWANEAATWRKWDLIYERLQKGFLAGMRFAKESWSGVISEYNRTVFEQPVHFVGNWALFEGASITMEEFSFTPHGFPSSEFRRDMRGDGSTTDVWTKAGQDAAQTPTSRDQAVISGRSWTICPTTHTMAWSILALSSSQVILGHDLDILEVGELGTVFSKRYAGPSPATPWTNWCCLGDTRLHMQMHVSFLSPQLNDITDSGQESYSGLRFERDGWTITGEGNKYSIVESRSSIGIIMSLWDQFPCYSIVTLNDNSDICLDYIEDQVSWDDTELSPCHDFAGVAIFQLAIWRLITVWGEQWNSIIRLISSIPRTKIDGVRERVKRRYLRSGRFKIRGRISTKQLLIKSSKMIREFSVNLQNFKEDLVLSTIVNGPEEIGINCERLITYQQSIQSDLLDLIDKEIAERDSMDAPPTQKTQSPEADI